MPRWARWWYGFIGRIERVIDVIAQYFPSSKALIIILVASIADRASKKPNCLFDNSPALSIIKYNRLKIILSRYCIQKADSSIWCWFINSLLSFRIRTSFCDQSIGNDPSLRQSLNICVIMFGAVLIVSVSALLGILSMSSTTSSSVTGGIPSVHVNIVGKAIPNMCFFRVDFVFWTVVRHFAISVFYQWLSSAIPVKLVFLRKRNTRSPSSDFDDQPVPVLFRLGFTALGHLSIVIYIAWWSLRVYSSLTCQCIRLTIDPLTKVRFRTKPSSPRLNVLILRVMFEQEKMLS